MTDEATGATGITPTSTDAATPALQESVIITATKDENGITYKVGDTDVTQKAGDGTVTGIKWGADSLKNQNNITCDFSKLKASDIPLLSPTNPTVSTMLVKDGIDDNTIATTIAEQTNMQNVTIKSGQTTWKIKGKELSEKTTTEDGTQYTYQGYDGENFYYRVTKKGDSEVLQVRDSNGSYQDATSVQKIVYNVEMGAQGAMDKMGEWGEDVKTAMQARMQQLENLGDKLSTKAQTEYAALKTAFTDAGFSIGNIGAVIDNLDNESLTKKAYNKFVTPITEGTTTATKIGGGAAILAGTVGLGYFGSKAIDKMFGLVDEDGKPKTGFWAGTKKILAWPLKGLAFVGGGLASLAATGTVVKWLRNRQSEQDAKDAAANTTPPARVGMENAVAQADAYKTFTRDPSAEGTKGRPGNVMGA